MKDSVRWRHRRKGRFGPDSPAELLMSVLDAKNFKEVKEGQLEDDGVEDNFSAASVQRQGGT